MSAGAMVARPRFLAYCPDPRPGPPPPPPGTPDFLWAHGGPPPIGRQTPARAPIGRDGDSCRLVVTSRSWCPRDETSVVVESCLLAPACSYNSTATQHTAVPIMTKWPLGWGQHHPLLSCGYTPPLDKVSPCGHLVFAARGRLRGARPPNQVWPLLTTLNIHQVVLTPASSPSCPHPSLLSKLSSPPPASPHLIPNPIFNQAAAAAALVPGVSPLLLSHTRHWPWPALMQTTVFIGF